MALGAQASVVLSWTRRTVALSTRCVAPLRSAVLVCMLTEKVPYVEAVVAPGSSGWRLAQPHQHHQLPLLPAAGRLVEHHGRYGLALCGVGVSSVRDTHSQSGGRAVARQAVRVAAPSSPSFH